MSENHQRVWIRVKVYRDQCALCLAPTEPADLARFAAGQCWLLSGESIDDVAIVSLVAIAESSAELRLIDGRIPPWSADGSVTLSALRCAVLESADHVQTPANQESES